MAHFIKCDKCDAFLDRRPAGDHRDGGAFRHVQELLEHAKALGWVVAPFEILLRGDFEAGAKGATPSWELY